MTTHHARAAVVSMGDELTLGQRLDTNSRWISEKLVDRGIVPVEHVTVPDDMEATSAALRRLAGKVDVIVSSGGLGPTADDLTREAISLASGDMLVEDPDALAQIEAWFRGRGREMPVLNRGQAMRPSRGRSLRNEWGTAPGIAAAVGACDVFCLPGPPREMMPMFERHVAPALRPAPGRTVLTRSLHCFGIGESDLASRLGALMDRGRSPVVGTTASGGVVSIRIRYEGDLPSDRATRVMDDTEREARRAGEPFVFGMGEQSLAGAVLDALKSRSESLATVESCTGGMLGSMITDVPGSSAAYLGGWVTYANEMKIGEIGVDPDLISRHGAVSREVAEAMATGALARSPATHALAITGVAGPGGGSADKPVGTVWIALASRAGGAPGREGASPRTDVRHFRMGEDRANVREWSSRTALMMLWHRVNGVEGIRFLRELTGTPA